MYSEEVVKSRQRKRETRKHYMGKEDSDKNPKEEGLVVLPESIEFVPGHEGAKGHEQVRGKGQQKEADDMHCRRIGKVRRDHACIGDEQQQRCNLYTPAH